MALRSNSSFSSNESSLLEDSLKKLQEQIDAGCYDADEALSEVERLLVEGRDQHAKGSTTSGDERRDALRRAQKAAEISEKWLNTLPPELQDKTTYAEALLLQANTLAHLAKHEKNDAMFETARRKTEEAVVLLQGAARGNAYRIQGVIEFNQNRFQEAENKFTLALQTYLAGCPGQFPKTIWCAVALWNLHLIFLKTKTRQEAAVAFLKQATLLRAEIDGKNGAFPNLYKSQLSTLTMDPKPKLDLSKEEVQMIEETLGVDLPGRLCVLGGFTLGH